MDLTKVVLQRNRKRQISLVSEQKDGDTIKRINLNYGKSLFVIAIVEHESKVNFRAPFKMLLYIALILKAEAERKLKATIRALIDKGSTVTEIASIMNVTEDEVIALLPELAPA